MGDNKKNKEHENQLMFSPLLFTVNYEFNPIKFAMNPCKQKRRVRELIEMGGGYVTKANHNYDNHVNDGNGDHVIHLIDRNQPIISIHNDIRYYYCDYIYDCCEANELLDLDRYRHQTETNTFVIHNNDAIASTNTDNESHHSSDNPIDFQLLTYIISRKAFTDLCGNSLWTKAFDDGINFDDKWESTKSRFFDVIMPNIDNYSIDEHYKQQFKIYYQKQYNNLESNENTNSLEKNTSKSLNSIPNIVITPPSPSLSHSDETEFIDTTNPRNHEQSNQNIDVQQTNAKHVTTKENIEITEKQQNINENSLLAMNKNGETNDIRSNSFFASDKRQPNDVNAVKAYLDFVKQRKIETSNENMQLKRIKEAMKVTKKPESVNQQNKSVSLSKQTHKSNFGTKILQNIKKASRKSKRSESFSSESGDQVSDISSDDSNTMENERSDSDSDSIISLKYSKKNYSVSRVKMSPFRQKSTALYDLSEDEAIIKYILQSNCLTELKGNAVWINAEKKKVCDRRTWQSMKERFRKHVMPNIDSYSISNKEKSRLKKYFFAEKDDTAKSANGSYNEEEDRKIIRYIVTKQEYNSVTGNALWQQMEKYQVTNRTWQSMKERFKKRIIPNLNKYKLKLDYVKRLLAATNWLTSDQQKQLLNKCEKVLQNTNTINTNLKKRALPIYHPQNNTDLESEAETTETETKLKQTKRTKKV